jgi:hypothetical protein
MVWPVAALAVLMLGFVVAYGSVVQSRLESYAGRAPDTRGETEPDGLTD